MSSEGIWIVFLILFSSALSLIYLWKMIEALWLHENIKKIIINENPFIYISLLIITFLNIYFGLDASLIVNSSEGAANTLMGFSK
jgi:multicomponent Na+:H+ antiporter subunit D